MTTSSHINFLIEDYREVLEMKITIASLEQSSVGRTHLSGLRTV
jgi:hypothetical protein